MPTVSGMKGEGFYDQHSSYQRVTIDGFRAWMTTAVAELVLPDEPRPIGVADFGCSEGTNSISAVGTVMDALRCRRPVQALCGIHNDLPTSNFNQLFRNLHDAAASNYLQEHGKPKPNVSALAVGGSFFGPLLPPGSVHFALSFTAVCWMDQVPAVPVPEFIGYMGCSPAAREAFARQAERDLTAFYEHRAAELAPGGKLLVVVPGGDGQCLCGDGLYHVLNDAGADLAAAGRINRSLWERFVMPVYFRTREEMLAPLAQRGSPLREAFTVDRAETVELPTPFAERYRQTGDLESYARGYTGFLRAFSEPVVMPGVAGDLVLMDELYERVRQRLIAEPERYRMRNIEAAVLLTRR